MLAPVLGPELMFDAPLREPLEQLLKLEHQCRVLWYPGIGTEEYFSQLSGRCRERKEGLHGEARGPRWREN